ncbi:ShlB/FhaC/HecB family hemolysin secretion/activation protein [Rhizobium skierniewicense]|uniref:ShlB/FhaC/HecB family hemolysin secretion/activation protein n=1 Tax=Rhizobium skierniewicense TaxID=984260 RepID=UPI001FADC34D|nr:ShlB/FhaC/HecB family hemolysin secretion/activation protein [Rhizobium skierniewicense]MCI9868907.1 ShlB/FhaC/HecB family hemolysin secretion/activation protein [Rhizobium skierniewicense]
MMSNSRLIAFWILLVFTGSPALAQSTDPSNVTPKSFAPVQRHQGGGMTLGATEPGNVPDGAEKYTVLIASSSVEGGLPQLKSRTDAVLARINGKTVSVETLYAAATEIEAAYAQAGFVLARVIIPPQELVDGGVFKLIVLDGFIESVDASGVPERVRDVVRDRVASLIGASGLTIGEIERRLLLAGEVPGLQLASAVMRGEKIGGAKLVLQADWRPVTASIGVDNKVGSLYRDAEFPVTVSLNSVFGFGETIYASLITGPDVDTVFSGLPSRQIAAAGVILPVGIDGWTINPEYARSDTNPRLGPTAMRSTGVFERWAFRSLYPLIKTRQTTLTLTGSFEITDEKQTAPDFGVTTSLDRLRVFTAGFEGSHSLDWNAIVSGGVLVTQGTDWFGARTAVDAAASGVPLSRQGSRPDYTKIEADLRYEQVLPGDFTGAAILHAQQAISGPMPAGGQFSLQGDDALSAFDAGTLMADTGISVRGELGRVFSLADLGLTATASPYLFGAAGVGKIKAPTAVETSRLTATSFGAGLRFNFNSAVTGLWSFATIELGRGNSSIAGNDDTRITASWNIKY